MKIIFLRQRGDTRSLGISRRWLAVFTAFKLTLVGLLGVWIYGLANQDTIDPALVSHWRAQIVESEQRVREMEVATQAQSQAVGRQLANMQARLLRMEALGARVTEVAELPAEEFDFQAPPSQGGPQSISEQPIEWADLTAQLSTLATGLRSREHQFEVLENLLSDKEVQNNSAVAGRPVTWGWLSSQYGKRVDPLTGKSAWHSGVDFAGHDGSDVIAVASGVVTYAGKRSGYGKLVEITHPDGLVTRYAHHKSLVVSAGDVVKKGETIGKMGSTGRSTGPHVHFEVLKNGRTVDPTKYVARS